MTSDNVDGEILTQKFMDRFSLDDTQFGTVAKFITILMRKVDISLEAESLKTTRVDIEDFRSRVLDIMLDVAKMVDEESEASGEDNMTISESGVGIFSHERVTRAVIRVLDGMKVEEAAERAGIKPIALEVLRDSFEHRLLYMGALAAQQNPTWTAFDILKSLSDLNGFAEFNDQAIEYLDEDDAACVADEQEGEQSEENGEIN